MSSAMTMRPQRATPEGVSLIVPASTVRTRSRTLGKHHYALSDPRLLDNMPGPQRTTMVCRSTHACVYALQIRMGFGDRRVSSVYFRSRDAGARLGVDQTPQHPVAEQILGADAHVRVRVADRRQHRRRPGR